MRSENRTGGEKTWCVLREDGTRTFIRLDYGPVWFLVGLGLEPVHDLLVQLTPAIQQALIG